MPKVLEKSANNIANLLPPKRPPANRPQGDESFEHVLKRAQPKPEAEPKPRTPPEKPSAVETPVQADPQADPQAAPTEEAVADGELVELENELPAEDVPVDQPTSTPENPQIAVDAALVEYLLPIDVKPVVHAAPESPEIPETDADLPVRVAPLIQAAPIDEAPPQDELPDVPAEESAEHVAARIPAQPFMPEAAIEEEAAPVAQAVASTTVSKQAVPVELNPLTSTPAAEIPVEADASTDSEQPPADQGSLKSETPKLKLVQPSTEDAPEDGPPPQPLTLAEHVLMKETPEQASAPRIVDSPAPKAPVDAKPALPTPPPAPTPARADTDFAANNHERIVTSVRTQLLPNGGQMRIRLDPPELGALQIHIRMVDGVMQASFETTNDQATRLLSHTLSQLKTALETQGVSVDRLHVQQAPRDQQASSNSEDQRHRQSEQQDSQAQREQQRRELLNRMWRRIRLGRDPLDMVA